MSKNEGDILRKLVKSSDYQVNEFAEMLGMSRQNLNYLFNRKYIEQETKEKAAAIAGKTVSEAFYETTGSNATNDKEKETLRELVEAQKQIISYWREFQIAQLIRNEAYLSVILRRLAELQFQLDDRKKKRDLDTVLDEAERAVQEKIKELKGQLQLVVS
ncbi:hypothetical protein HGH92_21555 [Chitinophaga varians]|uniref:HTH cro/C1-type domain-containing protein n=1 Tax=Chitinophaga varians TaxID=2202339 RepID=A0A847RIP2_9BACT|nr:hypothetical protein [Chitinophaga varians]NLR66909.1 hypothetical protein [Chitinophaga varians]